MIKFFSWKIFSFYFWDLKKIYFAFFSVLTTKISSIINPFFNNVPFWSPWEHQKIKGFLFSGGSKGNIGKKRVNLWKVNNKWLAKLTINWLVSILWEILLVWFIYCRNDPLLLKLKAFRATILSTTRSFHVEMFG